MKRALVRAAAPGPLTLVGPRAHHLGVVLRVAPGDVVEIFDGLGTSFDATVESSTEGSVTLLLGPPRPTPAAREIVIVQGLPKADKLELVLQKGTELGASAFLPAPAARSIAKLDGKVDAKLERWRRIIEEAARQCGRSDVPRLLSPTPLATLSLPGTTVLVLDEEEQAVSLSAAVSSCAPSTPLALVIGPEGGLAREEVLALTAAGARAVSLGRNVLRTETAALAALSVIRHLDGLLG